MTSKMKCPVCNGDIQYNDSYSVWDCKNNPAEHYASEDIWQALIESHKDLVLSEQSADREIHRLRDLLSQYQKDLEIATKALDLAVGALKKINETYEEEYYKGDDEHDSCDWLNCADDMDDLATETLDEIKQLIKGANNGDIV